MVVEGDIFNRDIRVWYAPICPDFEGVISVSAVMRYIDKITIKSMKHTKSLLATEIYKIKGEYEKALIEVNSLLSDIDQEMPDSKILIELATQEKRQLTNENSEKA